MVIGNEIIYGSVFTLVLGVLGYLLARSIGQIDENIKNVWGKLDKLAEEAGDSYSRHDLTDERLKYLSERVARIEDKRNGSL